MVRHSLVRLAIDVIQFDPTIYPRASIDWRTTYRYQRSMSMGDVFPAITVAEIKGVYVLVDGYHRFQASKNLDRTEIDAEVIQCNTLVDAYIESLKRNILHGRPLSIYERLLAAMRLKKDAKLSMTEISKLLRMPAADIKRLTEQRVERVEGELVVKKALFRNVSLTTPRDQITFSDSNQVHLLKQVIILVKNHYLNVDNAEVSKLAVELKKLLNRFIRASP